MSRIKAKFSELAARDQKALISYIMVGFPDKKSTLKIVRGLVNGGTDIIELGFPFSDPLADGPVIQDASTASLENGTDIKSFFEVVKEIRGETEIPLVLMTYTNILYHMGYAKFIKEAKNAGIDGFILPDMSVEESEEYTKAARRHAMDTIFLVSVNTSRSRVQKIAKASSGFLYLVAVFGTTGIKTEIKRYTLQAIMDLKEYTKGSIPIGVGFGISTPEDVKRYVSARAAAGGGADAVIVGSAYLKLIKGTPKDRLESKIASFTASLKEQTLPKKQ